MKFLEAVKVKDGHYYVKITEILTAYSKSDVVEIARQHGLKIGKRFSTKRRIYAS